MDVGMSIASALYELKSEKRDITISGLMKSGMNIGKDMIGTMTNTLILAYTGGALITILIFAVGNLDLYEMLNKEILIEEKRVTSKIKKTLSYEKVIGQIAGQYITGTSLYSEILNKYLIDSNNYFRYVYSLDKIIIESNPGTYFTILYQNGESQEIRIGDTGLFAIDNAENIIDILCNDNYCFAMVNYLCQIAQGAYKEE